MKITKEKLRQIIREEKKRLVTEAHGLSADDLSKVKDLANSMEDPDLKRILKFIVKSNVLVNVTQDVTKMKGKKKEKATPVDEINNIIIDVLRQEGGAAGYDPIRDAVVKGVGMEKGFDEMLKMIIVAHPDVTQHEDSDYIETSGLR